MPASNSPICSREPASTAWRLEAKQPATKISPRSARSPSAAGPAPAGSGFLPSTSATRMGCPPPGRSVFTPFAAVRTLSRTRAAARVTLCLGLPNGRLGALAWPARPGAEMFEGVVFDVQSRRRPARRRGHRSTALSRACSTPPTESRICISGRCPGSIDDSFALLRRFAPGNDGNYNSHEHVRHNCPTE